MLGLSTTTTCSNHVVLPTQAASAVASATMTPLNVEVPSHRLLDLVSKVCFLEMEGRMPLQYLVLYSRSISYGSYGRW